MNFTIIELREKYRRKAKRVQRHNVEASRYYTNAQQWLSRNFGAELAAFEMLDDMRNRAEDALMSHLMFGTGTLFADGKKIGELKNAVASLLTIVVPMLGMSSCEKRASIPEAPQDTYWKHELGFTSHDLYCTATKTRVGAVIGGQAAVFEPYPRIEWFDGDELALAYVVKYARCPKKTP